MQLAHDFPDPRVRPNQPVVIRQVVVLVGADHGVRLPLILREFEHLHGERRTHPPNPQFVRQAAAQVRLHRVTVGRQDQAEAVDQGAVEVEDDRAWWHGENVRAQGRGVKPLVPVYVGRNECRTGDILA